VARALAIAPDQLIVAGDAPKAKGTGKTALVVALSLADGTERWRYVLDAPGDQLAYGAAVDATGNVYVAGQSNDQWTVLSLTSAGAHRWTVQDGRGTAHGIDVDRDGNLLVAGDDRIHWLVDKRRGSDGSALWRQKLAPAVQDIGGTIAYGIRAGADGSATITGVWAPPTGRTLRVERRDRDGNVVWAYVDPPGDPHEVGRAIALDAAGRAYVAGETASDWLVLAFDPDGKPLWRMRYDGGGTPANKDQALAIGVLPGDDLAVGGVTHPASGGGKVQWRIARYHQP
jgi:hypothetical protein